MIANTQGKQVESFRARKVQRLLIGSLLLIASHLAGMILDGWSTRSSFLPKMNADLKIDNGKIRLFSADN